MPRRKSLAAQRKEEIKRLLKFVPESVKQGFFIPYPGKTISGEKGEIFENCGYCNYFSICTDNISKIYNLKQSDPCISFFKEMKENK